MAAVYFYEGRWHDSDPKVVGSSDHVLFLASAVFDACRSIDGHIPDLENHSRRLITSAEALGLASPYTAEEVMELAVEGVRRMPNPRSEDIFVRPMMFATSGAGYGGVVPDPDSTVFIFPIYEVPLPPFEGFSTMFSSYRRPGRDQAPTTAKAAALYPNSGRALREASAAGFDNTIMPDPNGNVTEFAAANLYVVNDGAVRTPVWNATFLDGVTRRRVLQLLVDDGYDVAETTLTPDDVRAADEVFSTGNYAKVQPVTRIEDRELDVGPVTRRARELYFEWARGTERVI
ncbi:MAG: branched-chain amino acid aminotransferase [Gaiellales bacterium]